MGWTESIALLLLPLCVELHRRWVHYEKPFHLTRHDFAMMALKSSRSFRPFLVLVPLFSLRLWRDYRRYCREKSARGRGDKLPRLPRPGAGE